VRPGGRTARTRAAVLRAAEDALIEHGFAQLDLADIARHAAVGKTTVYRRWKSVPALVADLLIDMAEQSVPRADTGTLDGDLRANARLVQRTLTDSRQGPLFRAILAAALTDANTAAALHGFYEARITEWAACAEAAIDRGELPPDTDPREVIRAVSAPLYYRLLTGEPIDTQHADAAAAAAIAAAKAGAHRG
jgi:AcrR family transcriptional regulator